jgi:hypothetical protein
VPARRRLGRAGRPPETPEMTVDLHDGGRGQPGSSCVAQPFASSASLTSAGWRAPHRDSTSPRQFRHDMEGPRAAHEQHTRPPTSLTSPLRTRTSRTTHKEHTLDMYSLRHAFATAARQAKISSDARDRLLGSDRVTPTRCTTRMKMKWCRCWQRRLQDHSAVRRRRGLGHVVEQGEERRGR